MNKYVQQIIVQKGSPLIRLPRIWIVDQWAGVLLPAFKQLLAAAVPVVDVLPLPTVLLTCHHDNLVLENGNPDYLSILIHAGIHCFAVAIGIHQRNHVLQAMWIALDLLRTHAIPPPDNRTLQEGHAPLQAYPYIALNSVHSKLNMTLSHSNQKKKPTELLPMASRMLLSGLVFQFHRSGIYSRSNRGSLSFIYGASLFRAAGRSPAKNIIVGSHLVTF